MSIEKQSLTIHRYKYYTRATKAAVHKRSLNFILCVFVNATSKVVSPLSHLAFYDKAFSKVVSRPAAMPIVYC